MITTVIAFKKLGYKLCKTSLSTTAKDSFTVTNVNDIILFDGVCNFCNRGVDLVLTLDKSKKFKFCSLQSDKGKQLLKRIGRDQNDISSFVYIKSITPTSKEFYIKSEAALKIGESLGLAPLTTMGRFLVPIPLLRDSMYDMIATNRYNILGKRDSCRIGDIDRFII